MNQHRKLSAQFQLIAAAGITGIFHYIGFLWLNGLMENTLKPCSGNASGGIGCATGEFIEGVILFPSIWLITIISMIIVIKRLKIPRISLIIFLSTITIMAISFIFAARKIPDAGIVLAYPAVYLLYHWLFNTFLPHANQKGY